MTTAINIRGNLAAIERGLREEPKIARRAAVSAINRTLALSQTAGVRDLARAKRLPVRAARSRTKIRKASFQKLNAVLITLTQGLPIDKLAPRGAKRGGYLVAGQQFPDAFRTFGKRGSSAQQRLIFQRVTPGTRRSSGRPLTSSPNLPIERVKIELNPEADQIFARVTARAVREQLPRLFESQMAYRLARRPA